ncbi:C-type LECtin [Caenorhabditis elegans]|uniref:C-type LECtin n=1 Tax=Caenorhabditis elegans TaxID=6239 RepID=A8WFK8_CAEEL|nr:C-type LECtin [Caenorhabditis elegans]CCD67186.1 C-type LECtin [Caenorhabditis elegans]|eukprot:NP_508433.2 Uncharacterized protein CELE_C43H6.6 [Caenorhabditis elegans]
MRCTIWPLWLSRLLILYYLSVPVIVIAQNTTCSGTVVLNATKELQYLTTPNYELSYKYPPFLDCRFFIKAPDKTRVVVEIIDMEMEPRIFDECSDYVGFAEDVTEKNISKMLTLCETLTKRQYISSTNTLTIIFQSDELIEYRGARLSYQYHDITTCPPGWTELSDGKCVRHEIDQKTDWITAQNRCMEQQSNLITIETGAKTTELENLFKSVPTRFWTGDTDATTEGLLVGINDREAPNIPGRESGNSYTDNNDNNDCMTVHFGDNQPFRMDGCASFNAYICEMKKDGTTVLYPPPVQNIQDGSNSHNSAYALWLLLFLIGLLFLTIMAFLCFMCWKQKDARVHTETSGVQQNAFMSETTHRIDQQSRTSGNGQQIAPVASSSGGANRTSRNSPINVPIENNRPIKKFPMAPVPNRLPMAEEPSGGSEHVVETGILGANNDDDVESVSAAPRAQTRTLPPMPTREGTFQSINTRDGSTMRTRRNKELFERPVMHVLDNVSAISLDEFWSNKKP